MTIKSTVLLLAFAGITGSLRADDKWNIEKVDTSKLPPPAETKGVTYEKDIRPLFEGSCVRCHGAQRPKGDLRLDSREAVLKGGKDGHAVVPGDSKKSLLVAAAARVNDDIAMPPKFRPRRGGPGGPGGGPAGGPGNGPGGAPPQGGENPPAGGPGGPGGQRGFGPPPKPLTPEQVALVRAWIDQGAK
jgi:hypothetical protein